MSLSPFSFLLNLPTPSSPTPHPPAVILLSIYIRDIVKMRWGLRVTRGDLGAHWIPVSWESAAGGLSKLFFPAAVGLGSADVLHRKAACCILAWLGVLCVCVCACACAHACVCTRDPAVPPGHILRNGVPLPPPTPRLSQGDSKAVPTPRLERRCPAGSLGQRKSPLHPEQQPALVSRKEGQPGRGKWQLPTRVFV